ncbi:MAG: tryptophan--tRNA ligase [Candidatus Uhrbacteria bacterium]|nr:tryptophan--tRNA ligase [Candidatus Uhrbacteria bacterium]
MKELCFSGIQPTNVVHIGNYIGAVKQWADMQHRYPCMFCIVDLHAITVPQDPATLRQNNLRLASTYLACGLDPKRSHIFLQSEVAEHTELAWILGTITKIAELERMTQFKDKSIKRGENVGVGLFTYPALMAADILLYDTTIVPVGEDQLQHLELTRTVARRFNQQFGETFIVPKSLVQETGARIMGLDDPTGKMSKSAKSSLNYIALTDSDEDILKKIKKAVTDSDGIIAYDPLTRPAVSNLMTLFHHATGITMKDLTAQYEGKGYGAFKQDLADALIAMIKPIREKIEHYMSDPASLGKILDAGRDEAKALAEAKMKIVRERVGLGR